MPGVYRGFRNQGHYGGGGLRGHSQREERSREDAEDGVDGAEGGERGGSGLYRLPHDSGVPHTSQDRRIGGGLLHSGGDSERAGERGLPCRGWQTGCGEDAPHRLRPHPSWLYGTGE